MKKSCEVEGTHGKVEKEEKEEVDEDVFRLLDLPEELLEVLGKYLDVATTLALASTCSLLQARQKCNHLKNHLMCRALFLNTENCSVSQE